MNVFYFTIYILLRVKGTRVISDTNESEESEAVQESEENNNKSKNRIP